MAAAAGVLLLTIVLLAAICGLSAQTWRREAFNGPGQPELYDRPYYYPRYRSQAMAALDADGRCVTVCRADGCVQTCR